MTLAANPRVTLITANFNQARYLERAICSVLDQGYDQIEYFVMDGGSTDGSVEIIRRYEQHLAGWVSVDDDGQADALNAALAQSSGQIIGYLDADDRYEPFAIPEVVERMAASDYPDWVVGDTLQIDAEDRLIHYQRSHMPQSLEDMIRRPDQMFSHTASFWRSDVFRWLGWFESMLHYRFDLEFHCRLLSMGIEPVHLPKVLASRRLHLASKSAMAQHDASLEESQVLAHYHRLVTEAQVQAEIETDVETAIPSTWQINGWPMPMPNRPFRIDTDRAA